MALSASPDRVSFQSLREAMRDGCGAPLMSNFHDPSPQCSQTTRDLRVACGAIVNTFGEELLDTIWAHWDGDYEFGGLADIACERIGRCGDGDI